MRFTLKDNQGGWYLRGIRWEQLHIGQPMTQEVADRLYGALFKLMKYEDSGITPEQLNRL